MVFRENGRGKPQQKQTPPPTASVVQRAPRERRRNRRSLPATEAHRDADAKEVQPEDQLYQLKESGVPAPGADLDLQQEEGPGVSPSTSRRGERTDAQTDI